MTTRRLMYSVGVFVFAFALATTQAQQQGGGRGDTPALGAGTLIAGAWGSAALPLDSRGWGWLTKSYVTPAYKRPFWNKAKELLFTDKQVTSYTIASFHPTLYCEVAKRNGFVRLRMSATSTSCT